jgi:hypothetical protein
MMMDGQGGWIEQENREVMLAGEEVVMLDAASSGDRVQPIDLNRLRSQHPFLPIEPRPQIADYAYIAGGNSLTFPLATDVQMITITTTGNIAICFGGSYASQPLNTTIRGRQILLPANALRRFYCAGITSIDICAYSNTTHVCVEQYSQA